MTDKPTHTPAPTLDDDHDLRVYEPALGTSDASRTYALDVLDGTVTVRRRYVAGDPDPDPAANDDEPEDTTEVMVELTDFAGPVTVIIRGIEHTYE